MSAPADPSQHSRRSDVASGCTYCAGLLVSGVTVRTTWHGGNNLSRSRACHTCTRRIGHRQFCNEAEITKGLAQCAVDLFPQERLSSTIARGNAHSDNGTSDGVGF
jgi:hypothetical protein